MADQFHLTLTDNAPNNYAIIQGANYSFSVLFPGDYSTWIPSAQIRKNYADKDSVVLVEFTFATNEYDSGTDKTRFTAYLDAEETKELPVTPLRKTGESARLGTNVWCYDMEITNPDDITNVIKLIRLSYVEVLAEVTRD